MASGRHRRRDEESKLYTNKSYAKLQDFTEKMVLHVIQLVTCVLGKRKTMTEDDIVTVCRVMTAANFELNLVKNIGVFPKKMGHHFLSKVDGHFRLSKSACDGVARLYFTCMTKLSRGVLQKADPSVKKIKNDFVSETCEGMMLSKV